VNFLTRFSLHYCANDGSVVLYRHAYLPFAPYHGLVVGFEYHSDFYADEHLIDKVMYQVKKGYFLAELEMEYRAKPADENYWDSVVWLLRHGWLLDLPEGFATLEEAKKYGSFYCVKGPNGLYHGVDCFEVQALKLTGQAYTFINEDKEAAGDPQGG
jgi:hypothetical protein